MTTLTERQTRLVLHTRVVTGTGGGPDKTILNSPRFLADQGYPMVCAYMRDPSDSQFEALCRRAQQWQAPLVPVDDFGPTDFKIVQRFVDLCREHQPAIWHAHDYKSNLLGLLVRRHWPMKLVTTVHGWVKRTWKTPLYYAVDKMTLRHYDAVLAVSDDLYKASVKTGVPKSRCFMIPNAIDTEAFVRTRASEEMKKELDLPTQGLLIGSLGRLSFEKGFDLLLQAVSVLVQQGKDVHLALAGEGDQEENLRNQARALNIHDRVHFLGFVDAPADYLQALDVFVLSSRREGLPNVVLEAMALSLPVLSTTVAGVPSLITDRDNGLLVPTDSAHDLTIGLDRLLDDAELRVRLGQHARQTVEQSYSFVNRMQKVRNIYDQLFAE